jgi:hypothetical protein
MLSFNLFVDGILRKKKTWTKLCPEIKVQFTNIVLCLFFFVLIKTVFLFLCQNAVIDLLFNEFGCSLATR